MGLLLQAYNTYENHKDLIGVYNEGETAVLAPEGHITTKLGAEVTIDTNGKFISARKVPKEEPRRIIPVTPESMIRTSGICPHPLCDQIQYVSNYKPNKHEVYMTQLKEWAESDYSHPVVVAVYKYASKSGLLEDLASYDIIKLEKGILKDKKDEGLMIGWRIVTDDGNSISCWQDKSLMKTWAEYCRYRANSTKGLCMITGEEMPLAASHLKGIVPFAGNAKLISSNDDEGFSYRGRFLSNQEMKKLGYDMSHGVLTIGSSVSQKAHNALKWLIENQGVREGDRMFLCWSPTGIKIPPINSPLIISTNNNEKIKPSDYQDRLKKRLEGYQSLSADIDDKTILVSFQAASDGRLAVTYYNEMDTSDYLDRLKKWDEESSFYHYLFGMQSPYFMEFINCAYGTEQKEKLTVDDKLIPQNMQALISSKIDGHTFPVTIMNALVGRCSNLSSYSYINKQKILFTACAAIRKHSIDTKKEDFAMQVEKDRKDRSYQYGRLLAILEKAEYDTYSLEERNKREPNAMKAQMAFSKRPASTAKMLLEQIKSAYYPKLSASTRIFYEKLIGEIYDHLSDFPEHEIGRPLKETYLIGYYLQKNELFAKKQDKETENNNTTTTNNTEE